MSCLLRIAGTDLDIDALLKACGAEPKSMSRKGQPRFPRSQPTGPVHLHSGANFEVSGADFSELSIQIDDALSFLRERESFVRMLRDCPGVEGIFLDFGSEIRPPGWCWFSFPPDLLMAAGSLGIGLVLSVYPVCEDEGGAAQHDEQTP